MTRRLVVAVVLLTLTPAAGLVSTPSPASAAPIPHLPSPCDLAPSGAIKHACEVAQGVSNPVGAVDGIVGLAGDAASTAGVTLPDWATDPIGAFEGVLADTVNSAMGGLADLLASAPSPPIDTGWFANEYRPLMIVGVQLCFFVAFFYFVWFGLRGHVDLLGQAFKMFLVAIFFTATAPLFIRAAVQAADALSAGFVNWGGGGAGALTDRISEVTSGITKTGGLDSTVWWAKPLILLFVLLFTVFLVLVWMVALAVRSELIYVGTLAVPFVLVGIIDGKAKFAKWYFRALFGIIITKPILIATLVTGAWLVQQGAATDGPYALLTGFSILVVATFLFIPLFKMLLPAAAVAIAVVERGGHKAVSGVKSAGTIAVGAFAGGAGAAVAASAQAEPRTAPPLPREVAAT